MKTTEIIDIIEVAININQSIVDLIELGEKSTDKDLSEIAFTQVDYLGEDKLKLWDIVKKYYGIDEDYFLGDGYVVFLEECLSGEYRPEEVITQMIEPLVKEMNDI